MTASHHSGHGHAPGPGLRERLALAMLREAVDLTRQREAMFDRIAAVPAGRGRDKALGDLVMSEWAEKALLWFGWRLLPATTLTDRFSAPPA